MNVRTLIVGGLALALGLTTSALALALQGKKGSLEPLDALAKKAQDATFAEECKKAAGSLELDPVMHSFKPRAKGSAGAIRRPTSHIFITLTDEETPAKKGKSAKAEKAVK